ncbi:MAG: recombinase family protein [Anaerolineae bacterium]|jgi:DNA invertase Pin-like site-specific DNA recombinase|nr:recombinase family protein [Anaerolineae bacterium]
MSRKYSQLPPNARAIIWCAVSTTRQAGEDRASMDEQEAWALDMCRQNGWQVVDILRVNGHSRNYKDLNTLASDARAKGIDAFDRLITHLNKADFDVFICRDANRFARRASLLHYIVESIIYDCHAVIYSQHDGWITEDNMAGFAALKGYSIEKDMQWIREGLSMGRKRLFERGMPVSGNTPLSHKRVRNERTGKGIGIVVNEESKLLYERIGTLLLEGLSWDEVGKELYVCAMATTTVITAPHSVI